MDPKVNSFPCTARRAVVISVDIPKSFLIYQTWRIISASLYIQTVSHYALRIWFDKNPWLMIHNQLACNHMGTSNIEHTNAHQHTHRVVFQDCCHFGLSINRNKSIY